MRIAVVGGGIFGTTAAVAIARAGHETHLFESHDSLLSAASGINQYRLHRGYHYPRSSETARSALRAEQSFREEYGDALHEDGRHLYAIAKTGTRVSAAEFAAFCDRHGLAYRRVSVPELVDEHAIEAVFEVAESRFDPARLREAATRALARASVRLHLGESATLPLLESFDRIVLAAYARTNELLAEAGLPVQPYQFEVCEKPVVSLPRAYARTDLVILDGPFMCIDPLGASERYVLGNVVHAIHATNVGHHPAIPEAVRSVLNRGIVEPPSYSKFDAFVSHGAPFVPHLREAKHLGSMFTVRTVLPNQDSTDARLTSVEAVGARFIKIFSGKIGNCVLAAREVVALIDAR